MKKDIKRAKGVKSTIVNSSMKFFYLKTFIAGFMFPGIFIVALAFYVQITKNPGLLVWEYTLAPFIFAVWNVLFFMVVQRFKGVSIGLWGAVLGLIFGLSPLIYPQGHFIHMEATGRAIMGLVNLDLFNVFYHKIAWIWLPFFYFVMWKYIIRFFNNLWKCNC